MLVATLRQMASVGTLEMVMVTAAAESVGLPAIPAELLCDAVPARAPDVPLRTFNLAGAF